MPFRPAALVLCIAIAGCASAAGRGGTADATIEGVIRHPAHVVPALRICALGGEDGRPAHRCVATRAGADRYRIDGIAPGDYIVIAEAAEGLYRLGGHMQVVQCIRAPCPEQPKTVTVIAGATLRGIDLTHFYDEREDFPALPSD